MAKWVAVTKDIHADRSWKQFESYQFASSDNMVPLVGAEIARAAMAFPMAFVKKQNHFSLVGVLSLILGQNLFVGSSGEWLGDYVPSVFRGYPFRLARSNEGNDLVLCVDEESGLIRSDTSAIPFFDETDEISAPVSKVLDFLSKIEQSRTVTDQAVNSLVQAGLMTPWHLTIRENDQEKPVKGLFMIDETALNTLEDEVFLKLRRTGALSIAYGQMLSMSRIRLFETLVRARVQMAAEEQDIRAVFGSDDVISFD